MSFLFRPQRALLVEAMREVVELHSWDELAQHLNSGAYPARLLSVEPYWDMDTRIGDGNTHIVMAEYRDGVRAPAGFTNALVGE